MARWGVRLVSGGSPIAPEVRGLVDTAPLRTTLQAVFQLQEGTMARSIARQLEARRLWALAIVTSNYTTGQSIAWIQGRDLRDWERPTRRSRTAEISLDHVMASAALPLFFPAVHLAGAWHGAG